MHVADDARRTTLQYEPGLDGLRAIAITLVVLFHATDLHFPATGTAGVDLFFVLSGFLITTLLLRERHARGTVSFRRFYERRAWRLLPGLILLLGVVVTCLAITGAAITRVAAGAVAGILYSMNFVLATGNAENVPFGLTHLWSLAAEEQFYLVWPLVLFVVFRARTSVAALACGVAIIAFQVRALQLLHVNASPYHLFFGVDTRSLPIVAGCLLALLWSRDHIRQRITHLAGKLAVLALVCLCAVAYVNWWKLYVAGPLLVVAACSCVLVVNAFNRRSLVTRALSIAPMVWLGRISYSLYLWHHPVLVAFGVYGAGYTMRAVPAVAVAVMAATASYVLVETPLRKRRSLRRRNRVTGAPSAQPRPALETASGLVVPRADGPRPATSAESA